MLPGDAEVVARDPQLAALKAVLDDDRLTEHLRGCWTGVGSPPDAVRVTYLRYKARTMVVAAVEVETDRARDVRLLVATSTTAHAKLDKLRAYATRRGVEVLAAHDDLGLVLLPFEADRHLPGLHRLADRVGWLDHDLRGGRLRALAYKPHRRFVACVEVDGEPTAVVKVHQPAAARAPLAASGWASQMTSDRVPLPQLLASDPATGIAVARWLPGDALHQQAPDRRRATLRAVGKALGRLHQLDPIGLPERPTPSRPELVEAVGRLRPDLVDAAATITAPAGRCPTTAVHGDLSPDQVIHGPHGVALLDLDRAGAGCPAADLASWLAASVVDTPPDRAALHLPAPLVDGYRSVAGPATIDHVGQHLPVELLRRAADPFRHRRADWSASMTRIVELAADFSYQVGAA